MQAFYGLLVSFVVWCALVPATLIARLLGREEPGALGERLGLAPELPDPGVPRIVLHGVSAGEVASLEAILARWPSLPSPTRAVISVGNRDALVTARRLAGLYPQVVAGVVRLPWDRPRGVRRWLFRLRPRVVGVMETEIWPSLWRECEAQGVPLLSLGARIDPPDFRRYRLLRTFFARVLGAAEWIGARSEEDRGRFLALGVSPERIETIGDLKLDAPAPPELPDPIPERPVLLGACTHPGEEILLAGIFSRLRERFPDLRLVLAPRHTARATEVRRIVRRAGLDVDAVEVEGEMGALASRYREAAVVVLGGSWVPRGGHSPAEALRWGRAVVVGPWDDHHRETVEALAACEALIRLDRAEALESTLATLLASPERIRALGQRGRSEATRDHGVASRCLEVLGRHLDPGAAA